jgi:hypothetical protein
MAKADEIHYKLLAAALKHYFYAGKVHNGTADQMKATARRSIAAVRRVSMRVGDDDLSGLCESAERIVERD